MLLCFFSQCPPFLKVITNWRSNTRVHVWHLSIKLGTWPWLFVFEQTFLWVTNRWIVCNEPWTPFFVIFFLRGRWQAILFFCADLSLNDKQMNMTLSLVSGSSRLFLLVTNRLDRTSDHPCFSTQPFFWWQTYRYDTYDGPSSDFSLVANI